VDGFAPQFFSFFCASLILGTWGVWCPGAAVEALHSVGEKQSTPFGRHDADNKERWGYDFVRIFVACHFPVLCTYWRRPSRSSSSWPSKSTDAWRLRRTSLTTFNTSRPTLSPVSVSALRCHHRLSTSSDAPAFQLSATEFFSVAASQLLNISATEIHVGAVASYRETPEDSISLVVPSPTFQFWTG